VGITNENTGVKVTEPANFKKKLSSLVGGTRRSEVLSEMGSFCSLFALPGGYTEPVLASAIECVGAKCDFLSNLGRIEGLGQDVVAAAVNDLITSGAHPLFFLDYIATEEFDESVVENLVKSIATACREIGCSLVGGETAQMPGVYAPGHFDLAGSVVGVVERKKMLGAHKVRCGDQILGLPSSGLHSAGFHLVQAILGTNKKDEIEKINSTLDFNLIEELVRPTRIYVKEMEKISSLSGVHAAANITCGGLSENIQRIIPRELSASIQTDAMPIPEIFTWLAERGKVEVEEMYKSFNMGVGFVVIASYSSVGDLIDEGFTLLGDVKSHSHLESSE
jgi:phosphoribosylformylglycinamidine cyclo-ligase